MKALICTTPRLRNADVNCRNTRRTPGIPNLKLGTIPGATRRKVGSWTRNCAALPITDAHATATTRCDGARREPRHVREEELAMGVENAEAPGREYEQAGAGKENPYQGRRERVFRRRCTRHGQPLHERRRQKSRERPSQVAQRAATACQDAYELRCREHAGENYQ